MDTMELQQVQSHTLLRFAEASKDLYNLSVILGLCIGTKLIMASALDSMLSSQKVKVKVRVSSSGKLVSFPSGPWMFGVLSLG